MSPRKLRVLHSIRSTAAQPCPSQPLAARLCPCVPLRARIVQEITDSGRPPLNQCNKRSQSIVNLIALLRAESAAFLYQVLTNRLMCGFYTLRKFLEIKFDHSSVVQILPSGVGHGGLHAGVQGSEGSSRDTAPRR